MGGGYVKTDFRLEKFIFFRLLSRKYKGGTLIFFTHAWIYHKVDKKLFLLCKILHDCHIKFV